MRMWRLRWLRKNKNIQMKYLFLLIPLFSFSQKEIPKKANTITIVGVVFKEAANSLLDAGYTFEKVDSNFQTIKTEFKEGTGKNKWMRLRLYVRIKDSSAIVTGEWYNTLFIGSKLLGIEQTVENSTSKIEYTIGNPKACFNEMKEFALSLKKPVEYSIK